MPNGRRSRSRNFLQYVDQGFYSTRYFSSGNTEFLMQFQAGGFDADYNPKHAPDKVVNESGNGLSNIRGSRGNGAHHLEPHAG